VIDACDDRGRCLSWPTRSMPVEYRRPDAVPERGTNMQRQREGPLTTRDAVPEPRDTGGPSERRSSRAFYAPLTDIHRLDTPESLHEPRTDRSAWPWDEGSAFAPRADTATRPAAE